MSNTSGSVVAQLQGSPAVINLGSCWGTPNGQDLAIPSYWATGFQCVAEAILRRWTTSPGQLIDDPNYGYNLMDLISDDLSPADLIRAGQRAAAEAQKDERVLRASTTIALSVSGVLTVSSSIVTSAGPFQFVTSISAVGVTSLLVSP